jgi:hypothetical protein
MERRLGRFIEKAANKVTHLNHQEKNDVGYGLLGAAGFILLYAVTGLTNENWGGNLGGYVALATAALTAATGTVIKLR